MKKNKNLFIIGPYADRYCILTNEEVQQMYLRNIVRDPKTFYGVYDKTFTFISAEENQTYQHLKTLKEFGVVDEIYCQTVDSTYENLGAIYLRGCNNRYKCIGCGKYFEKLPESYKCDCGKTIRPDVLLNNEKYNLQLLEQFDAALKEYNTLFFIGFDFNEEEIIKQLYIETNKKFNKNGPVVAVAVGECNKQALYEEFHFDFIVDEKTDTAMGRLVDLFKTEQSK